MHLNSRTKFNTSAKVNRVTALATSGAFSKTADEIPPIWQDASERPTPTEPHDEQSRNDFVEQWLQALIPNWTTNFPVGQQQILVAVKAKDNQKGDL